MKNQGAKPSKQILMDEIEDVAIKVTALEFAVNTSGTSNMNLIALAKDIEKYLKGE